jgi:translation initiation factor IF-2
MPKEDKAIATTAPRRKAVKSADAAADAKSKAAAKPKTATVEKDKAPAKKKPAAHAPAPAVTEAPAAHAGAAAPAAGTKAKRPILTASEQRMEENRPVAAKPAADAAPAPTDAPVPAEPVAVASAAPALDEQALAAQQLKDKVVVIKPPIIVKDLAARLGLKPYQIIHHLMEMNIFTSANQALEEETARKLCVKLGFTFEIEKREKGAGQVHAPVKIVEPPKPEPAAPSWRRGRRAASRSTWAPTP